MARTDKRTSYIQHGLTHHPLYHTWYSMHRRCYYPDHEHYASYGGRGIKVCKEWFDIQAFISDMSNTYEKGLLLDRIDNNGDYCKQNCKWSTAIEQGNNKRTNMLITIGGITKTLANWRRYYNIKKPTYYYRVRSGWDIVKALTTPIKTPRIPV